MTLVYQFNRLIVAFQRWYRKKCFEGFMKCGRTEGLSIIGPIYLRNPNVHIGKNVTLYPGVMFQGTGDIFIGDNTFLGNNTIIYAEEGYSVHIGANCMIAPMVYITTTDHNISLCENNKPMSQNGVISRNTVIEDNVWLASYVTVLKGSVIKSGAVIGAKAMVKGEIESNSVCVGIPAKKIKMRQ